ncbi:MAG TPA: hypothetical protein VLT47_10840 [Anaeromyxobacteraceae bacterium]|nr:hypothetical protein [Anaeromyxobacteraceae bacterium]
MGQPKDPYPNRGPVEVTSISTAIKFSPPIVWVHVLSAGSGGLTVKTEDGTANTYTGLLAGDVLVGPFNELTSMTVAKIRYGDGPPPQSTSPVAAVAGNANLGAVQLSVAPAVSTTPIAVGTNDARVTRISLPIPLATSDGTFVESTMWIPKVAGTITGLSLSMPSAVTQSDTNYLTYTVAVRDGVGGSANTIASATTQVTGGLAFNAFQERSLGSLTNTSFTATSQITFKSAKTGTGQAITGDALLLVTFTVP